VNVKCSTDHKAHRTALISVSSALSQTPAYTARLVLRAMFLFTLPTFTYFEISDILRGVGWDGVFND